MVSHNGQHSHPKPVFDPDADVNIGDDDGGAAGEDRGTGTAASGESSAQLGGRPVPGAPNNGLRAQQRARKAIETSKSKAVQKIIYPPDDEAFECAYPFLWEGMTMFGYKDGASRIPWEVSIRRISGGYQVTITDHDLMQKLSVPVTRWEDIQQGLETQLLAANPGWIQFDKSWKNKKGLDKFKKKA